MAMTESDYVRMVRRARRAHLALDVPVSRRLARSVRAYARSLEQAVRGASGSRRQRLREMRDAARDLAGQLESEIETTVGEGVRLSANEVARIQDSATVRFVTENGTPGFTPPPNIRAASAYVARIRSGEEAVARRFRTLVSGAVERAAEEVDAIMERALLEQVPPERLARRLRGYVDGSQQFGSHLIVERDGAGAITGRKVDLRTLPRDVRGEARQMLFNSQRIAVTEMHTAAHEASAESMRRAPMVEAVEWRLASDRGRGRTPDECDVLARADYYGLGSGIYPTGSVPALPHPFDRCWRKPVFRPAGEWNSAKPTGSRDLSADGGVLSGVSDARDRRSRDAARNAILRAV